MSVLVLDGALGTELGLRGVELPPPVWSAEALFSVPEIVAEIHREYAAAGATVHTANTFRTRARCMPGRWREAAARALTLARESLPAEHRVAASIAPLEDCYRPDLSPPDCRPEHRELIRFVAAQRPDILLCESFAHVGEALVAAEEALATGIETWLSLCPGPDGTLLAPADVARAAGRAREMGVHAVLVNCVAAPRTLAYVRALSTAGVRFGAYANAGDIAEGMGWRRAPERHRVQAYRDCARAWRAAGASILGGCCGTGPAHIRALGDLED